MPDPLPTTTTSLKRIGDMMREREGYVPLSVRQSKITAWLWPRFPKFMTYDRARWLARRLP